MKRGDIYILTNTKTFYSGDIECTCIIKYIGGSKGEFYFYLCIFSAVVFNHMLER